MSDEELKARFLKLSAAQHGLMLERFLQALSSKTRGAYASYLHAPTSPVNADALIGANEIVHSVSGYLASQQRDAGEYAPAQIWETIWDKARIWKIESTLREALSAGLKKTAATKSAESTAKISTGTTAANQTQNETAKHV